MLEKDSIKCPCKKKKCERFGDCIACRAYHQDNKRYPIPYCERKRIKDK